MLGTLPSYQGRGAGSLIMRYGVEQADRDGRKAYLEASPSSVSLYRRFGFFEKDEVTVDVKGHGPYQNLCMVREPRGPS